MNHPVLYMRLLLAVIVAAIMAACASMGRPEGGPRDETPPVFVKSDPAPGSLNVNREKLTIEFDENIKLDDPTNKVVVSPAQKNMPKISAVGRRVTIELIDSLVPDATYTIDFTDAISDLNEGNGLDGFAFDFATGPTIDTLCISGMVFQAENLEPAQGMLVGVHSNLSDSAITNLPFERITKTNQYGQFTLRNLKEGSYRIFALTDQNRDNKWDRTEDIAFYDTVITPTAATVMRTDTLKDVSGNDSIVSVQATAYGPNDILLTWFNENYKAQYLMKYERRERNKLSFQMGAPSDTLPLLTIVGGPHDGEPASRWAVLKSSPTRDTLEYWITDSSIIKLDTLMVETRYLRTDSLDQLSWTTDTLNFTLRGQKKKESKKKDDDKKKDSDTDSLPPVTLMNLRALTPSSAEIYSRLELEAGQPLKSWNPEAIHLEVKEDTLWVETETPVFYMPDSLNPMLLRADYSWEPGTKYRLLVDSLGTTGIYDQWNGPLKFEFSVKALEEYANITFNITNLPGPAVVQLLSSQDKPVKTAIVENAKAIFRHVTPGTYYARLFLDRNENGIYDTGNLLDSIQPEEVYYYPKKITLKKNWDVEQNWDIYETPVELQKPNEIKKNKPKKKRGELDDQYDEEDDQYYDEFGNPAVAPDDPFGKRGKNRNYNRNNRNTTNNGLNGFRGGSGGRSQAY